MRFTFRSGQRPLDGYTIKRGVGQGGFGEVYLAVSDGGKEVALKLLKGHTDIELRGIAQCLNLKHPGLVHLYDLRTDAVGNKWVVMEYVAGESLAAVLNRHPTGVPPQLARDWFLSLARGVGYLHDYGVVHRDLKPANIFVEHGLLKVGDYGLCKTITGSQRNEQSRSVGTVHYMAPEVGSGNYSKSVDVYACGVILYELLTGRVPFDGETHGEILMKHLTAAPDLSAVPAAYGPVLKLALEKNPVRRYESMAVFARAVEGVSLTAPAAAAGPAAPAAPTPVAEPVEMIPVAAVAPPLPAAQPVEPPKYASGPLTLGFRDKLSDFLGAVAFAPLVAAACTAPMALFQTTVEWSVLGRLFILTTALSWAVLLATRVPVKGPGDTWGRRGRMLLAGLAVGVLAFWLDGWGMPQRIGGSDANVPEEHRYFGELVQMTPQAFSTGMGYLLYFGLAAAACRWWKLADRRRKERFTLFGPVAAAFWGGVFLFVWPWQAAVAALGVVPLVLTAVVVQAVSPWTPPPPPPPKKLRLKYA